MAIGLRVLVWLVALAPSTLPAQQTQVMADSGARVLIRRERGFSISGQLLEVRADSLVLRTQMEPRRALARDNIRDIRRSMGRTPSRGMRQGFLGVAGTTMLLCWVAIGVAGAAEGHPEALILAPLFCAPGAAVFGLFGAAFGLMTGADIWVPATLPEVSQP